MVTLTADEAHALATAARAEERAKRLFELALARARLPLLEAAAAKNELVEQLARVYGFDPDRPLTFDAPTRTLTQDEGAAAPALA
jgi:hypothetical protein